MTVTEWIPIPEAERQRRAKSIHSIRRSQMMEGGDISPFAQELFNKYIEGQLTMPEVRAELAKHYSTIYGVTIK